MAVSRNNMLEYLQVYKNRKENIDIEFVKIEVRLEDRIKEVKTES